MQAIPMKTLSLLFDTYLINGDAGVLLFYLGVAFAGGTVTWLICVKLCEIFTQRNRNI